MARSPFAAHPKGAWRQLGAYGMGAGLVAVATAVGLIGYPALSTTGLVMLDLAAVVVAALYLGNGPAILVAVAGVAATDYFFVQPRFTFAVDMAQDLMTLIGLLSVGVVISTLTARVRREAEVARQREAEAMHLYAFSRALTSAVDLEGVLRTVVDHAGTALGCEAALLLTKDGSLELRTFTPGMALTTEEIDLACAVHADLTAVEMHLLLDRSQATQFLPLEASNGAVGVLAIRMATPAGQRRVEFWRLAQAFAAQAGLAIERVRLAEAARRAQMLEAAERLQAALLNSISHDLRTPLVGITGALTMLRDSDTQMDAEARRGLVSDACAEADHLNRLVGHLLDMARIEAGAMHLAPEPCDVQDVVGTALEQAADRLAGRQLRTELPAELPLVNMDFVLIVQVLVNLIDNAIKYSPDGAPIEISATIEESMLRLEVADRGTGVPADDLARVFDKFYRVHRPDAVAGSGLGLAICKGIVEAHNGAIAAANRPGGGTVISFTLPAMRDAARAGEERR